MKRKRAALYNPYLDTLGGGEKYILSVLKVFEDEGFSLDIFWDENLQEDFKVKFNLSFDYLINFVPNPFKEQFAFIKKLLQLKKYEYFFYVTDGSYFFSSAKNNFIYAMVPQKSLYTVKGVDKIKLLNYKFITHSQFTQDFLKKHGIDSFILYPYLDREFIQAEPITFRKEKIILSVGRFFKHLHSKNQDKIIRSFNRLQKSDEKFKDYRLILAGGLKNEDTPYFESLKKSSKNNKSILFKPNITFHELFDLYKRASFYWHFTGLGADEKSQPETVEHLGISPLEAMSMGCLTFGVNSGGLRENIKDGQTGFLFTNEDTLFKKMKNIIEKPEEQEKIRISAKEYILDHFTFSKFKKNVKELIL